MGISKEIYYSASFTKPNSYEVFLTQKELSEYYDNINFRTTGNLLDRSNSQLFYVFYQFRAGEKSPAGLSDFMKVLSTNTLSVNIPAVDISLDSQNLFNKAYLYYTDWEYGKTIDLTFLDNSNLRIMKWFHGWADLLFHNKNSNIGYYPKDLFWFDIYFFPLRIVKDIKYKEAVFIPDPRQTAILFKTCMLNNFGELSYDVTGDANPIILPVSFAFEEKYILTPNE